jgi:hypothetical protein
MFKAVRFCFFLVILQAIFFRVRYLDTCVLSRITYKIRWMGNAVPSPERSGKRGGHNCPPHPPKKLGEGGGGAYLSPPSPHWWWRGRGKIMFYGDRTLKIAPIVIWILLRPGGIIVLTFIHTHVRVKTDEGFRRLEAAKRKKKYIFCVVFFRAQGVSASGGAFTSTTILVINHVQ